MFSHLTQLHLVKSITSLRNNCVYKRVGLRDALQLNRSATGQTSRTYALRPLYDSSVPSRGRCKTGNVFHRATGKPGGGYSAGDAAASVIGLGR